MKKYFGNTPKDKRDTRTEPIVEVDERWAINLLKQELAGSFNPAQSDVRDHSKTESKPQAKAATNSNATLKSERALKSDTCSISDTGANKVQHEHVNVENINVERPNIESNKTHIENENSDIPIISDRLTAIETQILNQKSAPPKRRKNPFIRIKKPKSFIKWYAKRLLRTVQDDRFYR